ncbi:hypothetical protein GTQ43_08600 [Nostoc sp. KVJ3]|uniref:hypothetical protein n=1 Tax=Nostoc sp. KVJ3 TaxID=457945 RepID=UPI002238C126|nr:hypothetical protein [Nostoc sp. KVJ3]MCW5313863.1 hypothetical protein [Nostoc sp. KVJ3]
MEILERKDAINRRQDEKIIIVETAIHRVSCLNRTVLSGEWGMGNGEEITNAQCSMPNA